MNEDLLKELESRARKADLKYELRLAMSLRDILKIHEIDKWSIQQIKCYADAFYYLINHWGEITRQNLMNVRSLLLSSDLTWLPVTEKAEKQIEEWKKIQKKEWNKQCKEIMK